MKRKNQFSLLMLTTLAFFVAIEIVLSRWLSFQTWNFKISFSFIPIVLVAMLYGPLAAGTVAGLADFIGAILFPIGAYFPGFTFTAFFNGMIYGIFLKKKQSMPHVVMAVVITHLVGSLLLNTFWISMLYGTPFLALLPLRIGQNIAMMIVQIVLIPMLSKLLVPKFKALAL